MSVQLSYAINPDAGFQGLLAEPSSPHRTDSGVIQVGGSITRAPRPGDAVYYNTTENAFEVPTSGAQSLLVNGILTYRKDQVANADSIVEFADGDEVEIITVGVIWLTAGGAVEYGNQVEYQRGDYKWDAKTRVTAIADILPFPVFSVNRFASADTNLFKAAIGYGRAI